MIYLFSSALGQVHYDWDGDICHRIVLQQEPGSRLDPSLLSHADPVSEWLDQYFNGVVQPLPPLASAATQFQQRMRAELINIAAGEVRTYGEISKLLQTSPRAMGQALGANPLPIMIPCHRIVAADGLGGFAGGAIWKQKLLNFEALL